MALRKLTEANLVPKEALAEYAIGGLTDIDNVFVSFYDSYVQYERDLADWNMKYAPRPVYTPSLNIMTPPVNSPVPSPTVSTSPPATTPVTTPSV